MPKARSTPRRPTLGDGSSSLLEEGVGNIHRKLGNDSDNPTYIFTEPRVGYRMPKGETWGGETEWLSPRG